MFGVGCSILDVSADNVFHIACFCPDQPDALPALAPPYGELPATFWEQHGAAIIAGVASLAVLAGLIVWKLLQPRPPVVLPPERVAREALAKLLQKDEDGKCLSEISQILRGYAAAVCEFPPGELTTAEFCAALDRNENVPGEFAQSISSFLRECDERKFARSQASARPGPPEGGTPNALPPLNAANRALELISLVKETRDRQDACPTRT